MFRTSFDKNLDNATSHLLLEPEWPSIMLICDAINQKDSNPKTSFAAIKKKMNSPNPHSAYYALLVLESVVKNCGAPMHDEVFTKENCTMFSQFLEQTTHENVRAKMLELIQTWAYAFRNMDKYQAIKDTMTILKAKDYPFPELKEADAMFAMDTAPHWTDGKKCHRCRDDFTFTNRKHHCRNCGQVFCGQCTSKQCPLPKFGIEKDVRVCDGCYAQLQRPSSAVKAVTTLRTAESDLPVEYLNSSLAQQVQTPPRKTEQELKEEDELQLALALSQSEAEIKKQQQAQHSLAAATYRMQQRSPSPEAPSVPTEEPQAEETNPDLAKYLNRAYWEQRKVNDSPMASPSAPSPMPPTPQPQQDMQQQMPLNANDFRPKTTDEQKIDEFAGNMRMQVEIFVNRMKSNSSRGRSISNDSSVQTLFMTLTGLHSQQLSYIKELDDKRMWYEQLQDKLAQIKDSRAALDDLRNEHADKLRHMAEEQERQRQIQMAHKLEIMRKKKQEYLQYQRQLALHRIQEQEREMQMRQEQQMAQYRMNQTAFPFMPAMAGMPAQGSPLQQMPGVYNPYSPNPNTAAGPVGMPPYNTTQAGMSGVLPGMYTQAPGMMPGQPQLPNMMMHQSPINQQQHLTHQLPPGMMGQHQAQAQQMGEQQQHQQGPQQMPHNQQGPQQQQQQQLQQMPHNHHPTHNNNMPGHNQPTPQQQQQQQQHPQQHMHTQGPPPQQHNPQLAHVMLQQQHLMHTQPPIPNMQQPQIQTTMAPAPPLQQQQPQQQQHPTSMAPPQPINQPPPPQQPQIPEPTPQASTQIQAVQAAPAPPRNDPEPAAPPAPQEPATAELICFD